MVHQCLWNRKRPSLLQIDLRHIFQRARDHGAGVLQIESLTRDAGKIQHLGYDHLVRRIRQKIRHMILEHNLSIPLRRGPRILQLGRPILMPTTRRVIILFERHPPNPPDSPPPCSLLLIAGVVASGAINTWSALKSVWNTTRRVAPRALQKDLFSDVKKMAAPARRPHLLRRRLHLPDPRPAGATGQRRNPNEGSEPRVDPVCLCAPKEPRP